MVFAAGCQENHQAFLMEMLDKVAEYTQSKSEATEIIDNDSEKWHNKTDVDKT